MTTTQTRTPIAFRAGMPLQFGTHFTQRVREYGYTKGQVLEAITNPYKVTPVSAYPGQWRFCGRAANGQPGIAVVVDYNDRTPRAVTCYLDGVRTALRPDQLNDPRALASTRALR